MQSMHTYINTQERWDLRRRIIDGRGTENQRTFGNMSLELDFIKLRMKKTFFLTDLDLSGNRCVTCICTRMYDYMYVCECVCVYMQTEKHDSDARVYD